MMSDLSSLVGRVHDLSRAHGLSDAQTSRAVERLAGAASTLAAATADEAAGIEQHLAAGLRKNLDDDPMLVRWALGLAATLSERAWEKFFHNFVVRTVAERRHIIETQQHRLGHPPPVTLVVNPTMACNLECPGCYAAEFAGGAAMKPALLRKVLEQARDLGTRFITLSGGEPFAYPQLLDVVEQFDDLTFLAYTNGTLIDESVADRLAALGNVLPALSVEGLAAETDARRGPGVHARVLNAMATLRERGLLFGISATATRQTVDTIATDGFIDSYLEQGARFAWVFAYLPVGEQPDLEQMLTPAQRDFLRRATLRWHHTKPLFVGDFSNDGASCGGCLSASRYAFVAPDGKVQPCTFVHFYTHNINDCSLADIFASPFFEAIRQCQPYDRNLLRPCKIIDHPKILRRLVTEHGAKPSYPKAAALLTDPDFRAHLDTFSEQYAPYAERAWRGEHYGNGHRALVPFSGFVDLYDRFADRMANAERQATGCAQPEQEPERLLEQALAGRDLTIVGDVHLHESADPSSPRDLTRLVEQHRPASPTAIVCNGDLFDLDRVAGEADHGMAAGAVAARIERILAAFPDLVEALRQYLRDGGVVVLVAGNHDAELLLPEAADSVRQAIDGRDEAPSGHGHHDEDSPCEACHLLGDSVFIVESIGLPKLLIEHGHQADPDAAFHPGMGVAIAKRRLSALPLASLITRLLLCRIPRFAIPEAAHLTGLPLLLGVLRRYRLAAAKMIVLFPIAALQIVWQSVLARRRGDVPADAEQITMAAPGTVAARLYVDRYFAGWAMALLIVGLVLSPLSVEVWGLAAALTVVLAFPPARRRRFTRRDRRIGSEYAAAALEGDLDLVVHGHTHGAFVREIGKGTYANHGAFERARGTVVRVAGEQAVPEAGRTYLRVQQEPLECSVESLASHTR